MRTRVNGWKVSKRKKPLSIRIRAFTIQPLRRIRFGTDLLSHVLPQYHRLWRAWLLCSEWEEVDTADIGTWIFLVDWSLVSSHWWLPGAYAQLIFYLFWSSSIWLAQWLMTQWLMTTNNDILLKEVSKSEKTTILVCSWLIVHGSWHILLWTMIHFPSTTIITCYEKASGN